MRKTKTLGLGLAAALALTACSESTAPSALDELVTLNAALFAADATLEDLGLARGPFGFEHGIAFGMGPGGMMGRGGPAGPPGGEKGIGGSLTGTRSATFYDKDGKEQAAYDSLTTARIHYVLDVSGDVARAGWTGSVARTRDMTVSGLLGVETTRTFNGKGSETVKRSRTLEDGTKTSFDMQGSFTQENFVVPVPGSDKKYPLSGKITRMLAVTVVNGPKGDETRKVTVVITFDGDNTATAVIDGETHEIDLDARPGAFPFKDGFGGFGRGKRGP